MDFTSLPTSVQNADVASRFDALAMGAASEACGSPGEVANEPTEGHHFHIDGNGAIDDTSRGTYWNLGKYDGDMEVIHAHLAQHAPDQLRQRAAHALIQIFVISWEGDCTSDCMLIASLIQIFVILWEGDWIAVKKLHTMASPIFARLPPQYSTLPPPYSHSSGPSRALLMTSDCF